jgi:hypothetical protein
MVANPCTNAGTVCIGVQDCLAGKPDSHFSEWSTSASPSAGSAVVAAAGSAAPTANSQAVDDHSTTNEVPAPSFEPRLFSVCPD